MKKKRHRKRRLHPQAPPHSPSAARARTYPSPAERERIIRRRDGLMKQAIKLLIATPPDRHKIAIERLVRKYGYQDVVRVFELIRDGGERPYFGDEAYLYREYRRTFARFGGERRFLSKPEFEDLTYRHGLMVVKREFKSLFRLGPGKRERELAALLLLHERMWDDLFPPMPPPRPPDFVAPQPDNYPPRLQGLLTLGWEADDEKAIRARIGNPAALKPFLPDLERMVFDEGLLSGWPAEPASWAPLHVLQLFGALCAYPLAGRLLRLMERENDWLSDLLPAVWGRMGPQAAEPLWAYLRERQYPPERRSIAMAGLQEIAMRERSYRRTVIDGLMQLLDESPAEDAQANGYIVFFLKMMDAVEALPLLRRIGAKVNSQIVDLDETIWHLENLE